MFMGTYTGVEAALDFFVIIFGIKHKKNLWHYTTGFSII